MQEHGGWRDLRVLINFYKIQCLPVTTWNTKHLSKQVVKITYTMEKTFSAVDTFKGLGAISFQTE